MTDLHPVRSLLTIAQTKLEAAMKNIATLERQAEMLRVEIAAYENVFRLLDNPQAAVASGGTVFEIVNKGDSNRTDRRRRGLSDTWKLILAWIGHQDEPPDTEAIYSFIVEKRLDVRRPNLRSQLSIYAGQGFLARNGRGYLLTELGVQAANGAFARFDVSVPRHAADVSGAGNQNISSTPEAAVPVMEAAE